MLKAPKIYVRDSGLLHSLMKLDGMASLEAHPKLGASWEGFALEQVLSVTGDRDAYFWSTHSGPEMDLVVFWHGQRLGFEFKYGDSPELTKSMHVAMDDLKLDRLFVVYPGRQSLKLPGRAELLSIRHLPARLQEIAAAGANG